MRLRAEAFDRGRQPWERQAARHRQDGCCPVHLMLVYDHASFANGVPALRFVVKGKEWTR